MNAGPKTPLADHPGTASRRRILAHTRLDFWLDALILVAFTLAYSLGFTGIATHEWLGIGLGAVLLVHLTLHWDWVIRTTRKLLRRDGRERFVWLVNLLLLLSMTLCIASGILQVPSPEALQRLERIREQIKAGVIRVRPDNGFQLGDTGNLIRTCEIEAALAAVVITISAIRRHRRRLRRTASRA
jgi:HAMP domain-containing protein